MKKAFVHFTKILSDQNLTRNFKKEEAEFEKTTTQHCKKQKKEEETTKKPQQSAWKSSSDILTKHTAKYHMTARIKCVRVWQKLASDVNITMFDSTLTRMDEVVVEVSL